MIDLFRLEQQTSQKNDRPESAALVGVLKAMHPPASQKPEQARDALSVKIEQVGQVVPPVAKHGHAQAKSFAAETAAITGMNCQTCIHRLDVTLWGCWLATGCRVGVVVHGRCDKYQGPQG